MVLRLLALITAEKDMNYSGEKEVRRDQVKANRNEGASGSEEEISYSRVRDWGRVAL